MIVRMFNDIQTLKETVTTKEELRATQNDLMNHIDGFVKLHETLDVEQRVGVGA